MIALENGSFSLFKRLQDWGWYVDVGHILNVDIRMNETKDQLITWGITEDSENNESCILGLQAMPARSSNPLANADTREAANEEGLLYLHFFRNRVLYERPSCIRFVLSHFANFIPYNLNKLNNQMQQFYKFITWRFVSPNMFRVPPRPSSGA
jgi:hypothetical protein